MQIIGAAIELRHLQGALKYMLESTAAEIAAIVQQGNCVIHFISTI